MGIIVVPHNDQEEKVLLAFLNSLQYEYTPVELYIAAPAEEKRQTLEEYNNEVAEAEAEYKKGNSISTDELKNNMKRW
jgi:hypothetical protein